MKSKPNILLVEDHVDTATALQRALAGSGYEVAVALGYAAALRIAQAVRFDVMLCDIRLPDGNGCDLLAELRGLYPLRAIALTALGMPEKVALCRKSGFDAYLLKPVRLETLRQAIDSVLAGVVGLFPDTPGAAVTPAYLAGDAT